MMLDELESKQRYNDYLREVAQAQLYQQVKADHSKWSQTILLRLGDLFIAVGRRLKARNGSQTDFQQV